MTNKIERRAEEIMYEQLLGKPYLPGKQDCATMIQDFFGDNFGLRFTDYSRPDGWWKAGMNLYYDIAADEGFKTVDIPINKLQIGDILLMAYGSSFPNHAAIYVGNGEVIHHFLDKLSTREAISHSMRNALLAIMRHRDIIITEPEVGTLHLEDFLSPYWKQRLVNDPNARSYLDNLKSKRAPAEVPSE